MTRKKLDFLLSTASHWLFTGNLILKYNTAERLFPSPSALLRNTALLFKAKLFKAQFLTKIAWMRYVNPWQRSSTDSVWTRLARGHFPVVLVVLESLAPVKRAYRWSIPKIFSFTAAPVQYCVLHYILVLFLQSCSSCFPTALSTTCFKTLVTGGTFFSLEKQSWHLCVGLFSLASFPEKVLTAVMTCSHSLLHLRRTCSEFRAGTKHPCCMSVLAVPLKFPIRVA